VLDSPAKDYMKIRTISVAF